MMARQMKANSPRTKDGSTFNGGDDDYLEEDQDDVFGDDDKEQVIDCAPEISLPGD